MEGLIGEITDVQEVFDTLNAACVACFGCDSSQISALFGVAYANAAGGLMKLVLVENDSAQQFKVSGGNQQISKKILDKIGHDKLLLEHVAQEIIQENDQVKVLFKNGLVIGAKKVIVTIPPNIIAKNLTFQPKLAYQKQRLYENMIMSNMTKTFTMFKTSFWLKDGYSGEVVSNGGLSLVFKDCEKGRVTR